MYACAHGAHSAHHAAPVSVGAPAEAVIRAWPAQTWPRALARPHLPAATATPQRTHVAPPVAKNRAARRHGAPAPASACAARRAGFSAPPEGERHLLSPCLKVHGGCRQSAHRACTLCSVAPSRTPFRGGCCFHYFLIPQEDVQKPNAFANGVRYSPGNKLG